jgi:hypothetical protein
MRLTTRVWKVLDAATDRSLLAPQPFFLLTAALTIIHSVTSVDLGFQALQIRIPLTIVAVLPLLATMMMAHMLTAGSPRLRVPLVLVAYAIGGAGRGTILELGIRAFGLTDETAVTFRIPGNAVLVTTSASFVSYSWVIVRRTLDSIAALDQETASLQQALTELQQRVSEQNSDHILVMSRTIVSELNRISNIDLDQRRAQMEQLVNEVVRPLSHDFAHRVDQWTPTHRPSANVTLRSSLQSLDPQRHLPPPIVAALFMMSGTMASASSLFGWRTALELTLIATVTLTLSMNAGYRVARRVVAGVEAPLRDALLGVIFFVLAIPPALSTTVALRNSDDPFVYVVPALVVTPLVSWLITIGRAAWYLGRDITIDLERTRDELRWAMARINSLSWYHRGFVSRLLHGPIQNTIQVGIMRLRSADDDAASEAILASVIKRIDEEIHSSTQAAALARIELKAIRDVTKTWGGVAEVGVSMSGDCRAALSADPAAASIVVDLVQELCSNAIRHGGAEHVEVACTMDQRVMTIRMTDDGIAWKAPESESGLGIKFLDSCTVYWTRERENDINALVMAIPVLTPESTLI